MNLHVVVADRDFECVFFDVYRQTAISGEEPEWELNPDVDGYALLGLPIKVVSNPELSGRHVWRIAPRHLYDFMFSIDQPRTASLVRFPPPNGRLRTCRFLGRHR